MVEGLGYVLGLSDDYDGHKAKSVHFGIAASLKVSANRDDQHDGLLPISSIVGKVQFKTKASRSG